MIGFILFVHITVCILLVIAILMQAGRGGGLTETFQSAESMFGTQTNTFMVRTTSILAAIFLATSLILAFHSSKGEQSLLANRKLLSTVPKSAATPEKNEGGFQIKVESPKPMAPPESSASGTQNVPVSPVTNAAK